MARYTLMTPYQLGYFVYRCWASTGDCLYVGKAGSTRGPVPVTERLRRHAREKPWWPEVAEIDFAEFPGYAEVMAEERTQILELRPMHNVDFARCRKEGHPMTGNGRCQVCAGNYHREYTREWRKGPGRLAYEAAYRERNRERLRIYQREYMRKRRAGEGEPT